MAFVCTLTLDKQGGVTLSVTDPASGAAQTIALDGSSVKITVSDGSQTSTFTQNATKLSIQCNEVTIDATTVTVSAKQTLKLESTQAASLVGNQKLELAGRVQAELSGASVGVKADGMLSAQAGGVAKLSGASVVLG